MQHTIDSRQYDGVLYDLTGTLVNTEPLHHKTYVMLLEQIGLPFMSYEEYRISFVGKTAKDIFAKVLPADTSLDNINSLMDGKEREPFFNFDGRRWR